MSAVTKNKEELLDERIIASFAIPLASIADGNLLNANEMPFSGRITRMRLRVTLAASTASKGSTLTLYKNSTAIPGIAQALTTANCTQGAEHKPASTDPGGTALTTADTLTLTASSTTTFGEGFICGEIWARPTR